MATIPTYPIPQVNRRLPVGAEVAPEGVHFRVWAPRRKQVQVVVADPAGERRADLALTAEKGGYFSAFVEGVGAGALYKLRLDGGDAFPDPASRFQPQGPHGPSQAIDPSTFQWTDGDWRGVSREGQVLYELHVGTFTRDGRWEAAARQLPELADLGVTVVEVMPVAEFPGRFGWGYDGVDLFAPYHGYGEPDDFRRFVDAAHALGLGVISSGSLTARFLYTPKLCGRSRSSPPSGSSMKVRMERVSFAFGRKTVLCRASLELVEGGITVVSGPSGSGKTTLVKLLAGMLRPREGSIRFDEEDVTTVPARRRDVGVVLQANPLTPWLSVRQNIALGLNRGRRRFSLRTSRRRPSRHTIQARVWDAAALLGLERLLDRRPSQLSSGEQQRVALARALAPRPALLLLDEPFSALDANLRRSIRCELASLLPKQGMTVLCVTQDQETSLLADQVVVLDQGRVVQAGPPLDCYRRPATPAAALCLGEASLVEVAVDACDGGAARTALGKFVLPPGPLRGWLLVRPEDVTEDPGGAVATVLDVREIGPHDRVVFGLAGGAEVLAYLPPRSSPEAGTKVRIGVRWRQPHFLAESSDPV